MPQLSYVFIKGTYVIINLTKYILERIDCSSSKVELKEGLTIKQIIEGRIAARHSEICIKNDRYMQYNDIKRDHVKYIAVY